MKCQLVHFRYTFYQQQVTYALTKITSPPGHDYYVSYSQLSSATALGA